MKKIILSIVILISFASMNAQKDELKNIQKAIKAGNVNEIKEAIKSAEAVVENSTPEFQAQLYFQKVNAYYMLYEKNYSKAESVFNASVALAKLYEVEKKDGKSKYSTQVTEIATKIKNSLVNQAIEAQKAEKYKLAQEQIMSAYKLSPSDTTYLYYASQFAIGDKNFNVATKILEDLIAMNFSDIRNMYYATNKATGEEQEFSDKLMRDLNIKSGDYIKPREAKSSSRRGDIVKTLALLYLEQKDTEKAKKAFADAKKTNPDDMSLLLTEANMYLDLKDFETYKSIVNEILSKNPNDADLLYNLGVVSTNAKENEEAIKYYKATIALKPDYANAHLNLAVTILEKEGEIVDQMNKLGNSAADNKKYDQFKKDREKVYQDAIPYLEKYVELDGLKNQDAAKTLLSIYLSLDLEDKYKALKAKM